MKVLLFLLLMFMVAVFAAAAGLMFIAILEMAIRIFFFFSEDLPYFIKKTLKNGLFKK